MVMGCFRETRGRAVSHKVEGPVSQLGTSHPHGAGGWQGARSCSTSCSEARSPAALRPRLLLPVLSRGAVRGPGAFAGEAGVGSVVFTGGCSCPAEPSHSPRRISAGWDCGRRHLPQSDGKQSAYVVCILQHDLDFKNVCCGHHYRTSETQKEGKFYFPFFFFSGVFLRFLWFCFLFFFFFVLSLVSIKADKVFLKQAEFSLT